MLCTVILEVEESWPCSGQGQCLLILILVRKTENTYSIFWHEYLKFKHKQTKESSSPIIDKEDNNKIKDVIFEFLTSTSANEGASGGGIELNKIDAEDPDISDYNMIPDTCKLADQLRVCLQESDEVPADYTRLFDTRLYSISTSLVPAAIKVYIFDNFEING